VRTAPADESGSTEVELGSRYARTLTAVAVGAAVLVVGAVIASTGLGEHRRSPALDEATIETPAASVPRVTVRTPPRRPGEPQALRLTRRPFPGVDLHASVAAVSSSGDLLIFDPDNGGGVRRPDPTGTARAHTVVSRSGGQLVQDRDRAVWVPTDASQRPVPLPIAPDATVLPAADHALVWLVRAAGSGRPVLALADAASGRELTSHELRHARALGDDGTGGLAVRGPDGSTFRLDGGTGDVTRLTAGPMLAISATHLVDVVCETRIECRWRLVDRATGADLRQGALPANLVWDQAGPLGQLSPDGRLLAVPVSAGRQLAIDVLQLHTGARQRVSHRGVQAAGGLLAHWSPDGRVLVWLDDAGHLNAVYRGVTYADEWSDLPPLTSMALVVEG
jgi:hypothetical protein